MGLNENKVVFWDGIESNGNEVPDGIYYISTGNSVVRVLKIR